MTGGRGGSLVVVVVVVKGGEGEEMINRGEVLLEEEPKRPVGCGSAKAEHSSSV